MTPDAAGSGPQQITADRHATVRPSRTIASAPNSGPGSSNTNAQRQPQLAAAAAVLLILQGLAHTEQQAGKSVLVVFPLLGAAPVLGWILGTRP